MKEVMKNANIINIYICAYIISQTKHIFHETTTYLSRYINVLQTLTSST